MVGFPLPLSLSVLSINLEVVRAEARGEGRLEAGRGGPGDLESEGGADQEDEEGGDDGGGVEGSAVLTVEKGEAGDEHVAHHNVGSLPVSSCRKVEPNDVNLAMAYLFPDWRRI